MWGLGSALSLQLQEALISVYVVLFGGLMVAFAVGASHEGLRLWFGFLHTPHGQLGFLLVAGNLTCGLRPNPNPNPNPTPNPYPNPYPKPNLTLYLILSLSLSLTLAVYPTLSPTLSLTLSLGGASARWGPSPPLSPTCTPATAG